MVEADLLTIFGLMLAPAFTGFIWGRWERMTNDVIEESLK